MDKVLAELHNVKSEFKAFDVNVLNLLRAVSVEDCKVVYSSDFIEHLDELYYELGDYKRPVIYDSKPEGENYMKTFYNEHGQVVKAIDYNFSDIILSEYFYTHQKDRITAYEIDQNKLIQLEVLVLDKHQKKEYYRYSPLGDINTGSQFNYQEDKLVSINAFSSNFICDQFTEYKILYDNDKLSQIIRVDEASKIFPNGQTIKIYDAN